MYAYKYDDDYDDISVIHILLFHMSVNSILVNCHRDFEYYMHMYLNIYDDD